MTPDDAAPERPGRPEDIQAVPVRHPGRWVAVVVLGVLFAMFVHAVVFARVKRGSVNQTRFGWDIVGHYFLTHLVFEGLWVTIQVTVIAMVIGILGGVLLAVMRLSDNPILSGSSWVYIWFFRGTPVLVQLLFWYNISYLFPKLSLGIPFGPTLVHLNPNTLVTSFFAASVGLGLNEAAYMAEIVRAGILSVDEGQHEAASSLGMSRALAMRRVILPQAMRVIIPPTGNETISMLKTSSLASVIVVVELTKTVQNIYSVTYQTVPMLIVASLWYIIITSVLTAGQFYVERYYSRGSARRLPPTPLQRFRTMLTTFHAPPSTLVTGVNPVGPGFGGAGH